MKICVIGDPHGCLDKIKKINLSKVDLILLTGDLGSANIARKISFENVERKKKGLSVKKYSNSIRKKAFLEAYNSSMRVVKYLKKFAPVYTIFGNVESSNSSTRRKSKIMGLDLPFLSKDINAFSNVRVINNRIVNFNGVRIGGLKYFLDTNWVQEFKPSDYGLMLVEAKKQASKAKKVLNWFGKLDILVCHQPPYGFLDKVNAKFAPKQWQGKNAGSKTVLRYVKKYKPKYVFCGHIHEGKGMKKIGVTTVYNLGVAGHKIINL